MICDKLHSKDATKSESIEDLVEYFNRKPCYGNDYNLSHKLYI